MKNYHQLYLIKKVGFIISLGFLVNGCALLHMDSARFDDGLDGPNAGNPYDKEAPTASDQQKGEDERQNRLLSAISHQDIILGMDQSQVMASWGNPRDVETAGNSGCGAERWIYYSGNSLSYGMEHPRIVYFENGHVVGWESARR